MVIGLSLPPAQSFAETWAGLQPAVQQVLRGEVLASKESVFRRVRAACLTGDGPELAERLAECCCSFGEGLAEGLEPAAAPKAFQQLRTTLQKLQTLCLWLPGRPLLELGQEAFRAALPNLAPATLDLVDEARRGRRAPELSGLLELFKELMLELPLAERCRAFYRREAQELELPLTKLLEHCERRLQEEQEYGTQEPCRELLPKDLELYGLDRESLRRAYRLQLPLARPWRRLIKRRVEEALETSEPVPRLLDLQEELQMLLQDFENSSELQLACKEQLEQSFAAPSMPRLLARHADELLRNDGELDGLLRLFRHLAAKDAFEAFYRRDLCRRLLSKAAPAEEQMVRMLREECGAAFTSKLEGMLKDVKVSQELSNEFVRGRALDVDFDICIIASGLWPAQANEATYPPLVASLKSDFQSFYSSRFAGRVLKWSPSLSNVTLRATLGRRCELLVSALQALVLLCFNRNASFSAADLVKAVAPDAQADVHRALVSLALHKHIKILNKEPRQREVLDSDVLSLHAGFCPRSFRVQVPQLAAKDQEEDDAKVETRLFEDRQMEVDATVVRIMKQKRTLQHQQLMAEAFKALSFPATAVDVKKRIDSLIEREYLQRDSEDFSLYRYLA